LNICCTSRWSFVNKAIASLPRARLPLEERDPPRDWEPALREDDAPREAVDLRAVFLLPPEAAPLRDSALAPPRED
jgi:hypothetical protein